MLCDFETDSLLEALTMLRKFIRPILGSVGALRVLASSHALNTRKLAGHSRLHANARILAALVFIFTSSVIAFGQQTTGSIVGTVKDQQGAVVNTAAVKATNVDTGYSRSAPANGYGEYRIDNLPVGRYTIEAKAPNFERFVQENLLLNVDQELTVEIKLVVGSQATTVTVTEAPPLVNTSDAVLGRTIEPNEIVGLPLVNRNIYSELSLTPGVMANNMSPTSNASGSPGFTVGLPSTDVQINGSIDGGNPEVAFYLDGGNNITGMRNYGNPSPNPDAVEEFRVETSAFSAQYGQFSAAVVSVITKSGTNQLHGGLFEFNRNTDFNAYPWGSTIKNPYHRNQYGGNVGGPIKHDKAFFFFSYAGLRQVAGAALTGAVVPTAAERLGDFTGDTFKVFTPGTKTQVDGTNRSPNCAVDTLNCIPSGLLDTSTKNFDNTSNTMGTSVPLPNGAAVPATGGAHYTGDYVTPTDENEYLGKYDQSLGQKDHATVGYFFIRSVSGPNGGGNIPWTINQSAANQTNANISEIHTFSSSTANQAWLTFTRAAGGRVNLPEFGPSTQTLASYGSDFQIQGPDALPAFSVGPFSATTTNAGPFTGSDNYELRDVVNITKGKHSLFLGGEFALDKTMFWADLLNFGSIGFATSAPTSTGDQMSDWVTGQISAFEQDTPYVTHLSTWHTAVFTQDNYRITPRFTVNLGIRWDIDTPPVDAHNRTASFNPGQQSTINPTAPLGMTFPGDKGVGRGIINTEYNHISPRIGFALDPFGDGKTAIRAGAGIFYGTTAGNEWNQPGNAAPFAIRESFGPQPSLSNIYGGVADNFLSTAPGGGIFPYTYTPGSPKFFPQAAIESISTRMKFPYIYQFNFSVQRQLPGRVSLTAAYVGTMAHNVPTMIDANYAPYSTAKGTPSTASSSVDQRRQFDSGIPGAAGTVGQNIFLIPGQTSNYNALQVSATKPLTRGFTISGFYVWSHALQSSNESADGQMTAQDFGYFGQPFTASNNSLGAIGGGLKEERGDMDANRDSNAAISAIWNFDYIHGSNKFIREALNGWSITPVLYMTSGGPFSITTGSTKNDDSAGANRPDYNTANPVSPKLGPHRCRVCSGGELSAWFNTAAFTANGPPGSNPNAPAGGIGPGGADGNVGRDTLIGPGLRDLDAGLFRDIHFERGAVFQFRAEFTNVLNWVSLANPAASLSSGTDGEITGAQGTQRIIQLGGRFTF
jgi:hypothetical protein